MIASVLLGLLAVTFCSARSDTQTPALTLCPGESNPTVDIESIVIKNAELGKKFRLNAELKVTDALADNPELFVSFARPDGTELDCPDYISNCELRLCGGTKIDELELNRDWNNTCPIEPGTYTAHVGVRINDDEDAQEFAGDGNLVVTVKVENGGNQVECVSFPVTIKLD
ncbi:uncharacterized protein LOC144141498 [Haemaphysalis longicornis]